MLMRDEPLKPLPLFRSLMADALANRPPERRASSTGGRVLNLLMEMVGSSGFRCVLIYRLGHTARYRLGWPGRILSKVFFWWNRHWYGCAIASTARLGEGLALPHPQGIVIGTGASVGPGAWIYHNVTLGGTAGRPGLPQIGADVRIMAGAVIAGPIRIGDAVMIGANAVVVRDVPSLQLVRAPAPLVSPLPERHIPPHYARREPETAPSDAAP